MKIRVADATYPNVGGKEADFGLAWTVEKTTSWKKGRHCMLKTQGAAS